MGSEGKEEERRGRGGRRRRRGGVQVVSYEHWAASRMGLTRFSYILFACPCYMNSTSYSIGRGGVYGWMYLASDGIDKDLELSFR